MRGKQRFSASVLQSHVVGAVRVNLLENNGNPLVVVDASLRGFSFSQVFCHILNAHFKYCRCFRRTIYYKDSSATYRLLH